MKPVLTVTPQPFMEDAGLKAVMAALGHGNALMVGGCVRGAILGEAGGDIDIATVLTPNAATKALESAGIKVVPTGLAHGTVTAVAGGKGYEITTLRRDVETDGRRAVVAFTTDWAEDAQRRDFTMNTLLMNLDGQVFDPTGQGVSDLQNGVVRFVGDAAMRIAEDSLRILRFFRFYARYGKGEPDAEGLKASAALAKNIENLSRERITHEVERMLPHPQAGAAITAMQKIGIMQDFWFSDFNQSVYECLRGYVVSRAPEAVFPTLFSYSVWENKADLMDAKIKKYIVLSNAKKFQLHKAVLFVHEHTDSVFKNVYTYGKTITLAGGLLHSSINAKGADTGAYEVLHEKLQSVRVLEMPLKAADLMRELGVAQGPQLGTLLKKVEGWWLDQEGVPDHTKCLQYAKSIAA
ncbi:MAG: CCA tRNA nucleotidyltransferase [Alphaproteobacteria bacterium]|nr:CCA tRNA nucleotidyltransferase [Alphaproteobacteria bacterium]